MALDNYDDFVISLLSGLVPQRLSSRKINRIIDYLEELSEEEDYINIIPRDNFSRYSQMFSDIKYTEGPFWYNVTPNITAYVPAFGQNMLPLLPYLAGKQSVAYPTGITIRSPLDANVTLHLFIFSYV